MKTAASLFLLALLCFGSTAAPPVAERPASATTLSGLSQADPKVLSSTLWNLADEQTLLPPPPQFSRLTDLLGAAVRVRGEAEDSGRVEELVFSMLRGRLIGGLVHLQENAARQESRAIVPFGALSWDESSRRFTLHADRAALDLSTASGEVQLDVTEPDAWIAAMIAGFGLLAQLDGYMAAVELDPWRGAFEQQPPVRLEGVITEVQRRELRGLQTEQIIIVVEDSRGAQSDVLLGPAWYVMSQDAAPIVGADAILEAAPVVLAESPAFVAVQMISRGWTLTLRDESGASQWSPGLSVFGEDDPGGQPGTGEDAWVIASHVLGIPVYAAGERFGTSDDLLVEVRSGTAAFVEIASGGLFGVGADRCVVPLSAATLEEPERLLVELSSAELREGTNFIGRGAGRYDDTAYRDRIYKFFGLPPVHFDTRRVDRWLRAEAAVTAAPLQVGLEQ